MFNNSITVTKNLLSDNYVKILVFVSIFLFAYIVYVITIKSLRGLKTEILPSYPFDLFIPRSGTWSVGYFLILLVFLALLVVFLINGKFVFGPA